MTAGMFRQPEGPRCIYLLDDDPDICRLVSSTLREFGFETVECHTAAELRRLLLVRVPDLCIVDLGLPDADGMDVVRELQATVPELFGSEAKEATPSVAVSARAGNRSLAGVARSSQAEHIRRVLDECGGDRTAACHLLGISPTTLWRRLKEAA